MGLAIFLACSSGAPPTPVVRVAVAGNFAIAFGELAQRFTARTGIWVEGSTGSTGQLYAQIVNGAPFDVFLAADSERPARLAEEGLVVSGSRFTYAVGQLVLYAPGWAPVESVRDALARRRPRHLAIANPNTAPYGAAARDVLTNLEVWERFRPVVVRGENVAQAFQFVRSGAADAGLVARSYVMQESADRYAIVPSRLHRTLRQDAVLLRRAADHEPAWVFLDYLRGDEARRVMIQHGYEGT